MSRRFHIASLTMITALLIGVSPTASADPKGEKILRQIDTNMTLAQDQHFIQDCVTQIPGKEPIKQVMDVHIKGTTFRRVEYLSPGDIKGMRVLVLSDDNVYTYLPAYRKVRRLANHVKDQGFMGTNFSAKDIGTVIYDPVYKAKFIKEDAKHWVISCRRREGKKTPYTRIDIDVQKDLNLPSELRYFNDKGVNIKTEQRTGYSCKGKICVPKTLKMIDHRRNDAWTAITWTTWEVNTGVKKSFFSLRKLQRGR